MKKAARALKKLLLQFACDRSPVNFNTLHWEVRSAGTDLNHLPTVFDCVTKRGIEVVVIDNLKGHVSIYLAHMAATARLSNAGLALRERETSHGETEYELWLKPVLTQAPVPTIAGQGAE